MDLLDHLRRSLHSLAPAAGYRVALSGGLDSVVLLHALGALRGELPPLGAIHVHHGLSPNADMWAEFCARLCRSLDLPCTVVRVDARPAPGESREAAARAARYRALTAALGPGEVLLSAHHQDDQAETLLLMLLRGAGVAGLAAMPVERPLGQGRLARPLLGLSREALHAYATAHGLSWVDDESNLDTGYDRNFLRHAILPRLRERWPSAPRALTRSAAHLAEAKELLAEMAEADRGRCLGSVTGTLSIAALQRLSAARRRNLLRHWLGGQGVTSPDTLHLRRIEQELLSARPDAEPRVGWRGGEVRRYRDDLFAFAAALPPVPAVTLAWSLERPLPLPAGLGTLVAEPALGQGIALERLGRVTVGFRHGGERCRPQGRAHSQVLKKLLQEAGIPPWERERMPLLFIDGALAQVGDHWTCAPFAAAAAVPGRIIRWMRPSAIASEGENDDNYAGPRA